MKNRDVSNRFRGQMLTHLFYSALISCLIEVFLIANVSMITSYLRETRYGSSFLQQMLELDTLMMLCYLLSGILIFSVSFLRLEEKSLRYIGKISSAIQNISEGDLNTTVEVMGDDEFSVMAVNLNKMVGDIRSLMEKEREAERTKNELITNVAHDLRTPLTSMIGYLELLSRSETLSPELQKKYLEIAYAKSRRLEKLIEDLFGFTKLNYGKISMQVSKVDLVKLMSQLLEEFYPNFMEKNLTYELKSNVPAQIIMADGNLLARLFDNLINNAIKYGADGKRVLVAIQAEKQVVSVSITNFGYVIPAGELPLIFNKFYRVEQSRSTHTGGTGLGLAIAKNIVEMHGGTISVASDWNGTVFTVKLRTDFDINRENFGMPE